jgi:hypothetical protein
LYVAAVSAPALRPLGIGEILDASLKIAWRNLGTLARIVLVVVGPAQILIAIVNISAIPDYRPRSSLFSSSGDQTIAGDEVWTYLAATLTALVIGFLASQFATGACFRAVAETYLGHKTGWRSSLAFAARKFHSILWIVLLGSLLTILGAFLCVIPGIYLWVSFAVALPVLMSEGQKGRRALGRSRSLVRGRWWKTAILLVVAGILSTLLSGLVSGAISALSLTGNNPVALFLIAAVAGTAGALISTPFTAAYHTVLYFDLRVRKEAFDLRLLASRLGIEPPPDWEPPPSQPGPPTTGSQPPFWPPPPGWTPEEQ